MHIKGLMDDKNEKLSEVQKFYFGQNILITGGTGFLGKVLLNKLFTSCPGIERIYMLVRKKKHSTVAKRVDNIFNDPIFDKMKCQMPEFREHIITVTGDCLLPDLGLNIDDRNMLIEKVNIVFHMAATVRFDEKFKVAMQINARAARDMMLLCNEMKNLKSYLHISTAYSCCPQSHIEEKFYTPPSDTKNLLLLTENIPEKILDSVTPILLGDYPNTYTFTKAVAEDIVKTYGENLPVGLFRPGIVISTYNEPVSGWIDNFYGPTGAIAGAGTGIIRSLRCNPQAIANMVPVDMCVNSIIAASWDVADKYGSTKIDETNKVKNPIVYNFCTSKDNKITWGDFTTKTTKYGLMYPTTKAVWYLCYANRPNRFMHMLSIFCLHYLPATILDGFCLLMGKKPRLLKTYKKIHRFMQVIEYFALREWEFDTDNVRNLWHRLSNRDKGLFFFDMAQMDWDRFLQVYFRGIRQYLLKDPIETIPQGVTHWNRLYWLHQLVKFVVFIISAKLLFYLYTKVVS